MKMELIPTIINLKSPVNSSGDDFGMIIENSMEKEVTSLLTEMEVKVEMIFISLNFLH